MFLLLSAQENPAHPRRLPDASDKCRLQCVRLPRTQDVRGVVLLPHSHVLRQDTIARHTRRNLTAAYDAAHDCSHLGAAMAHEPTHHAAATTPESLRHICAPSKEGRWLRVDKLRTRKSPSSRAPAKYACPPHDVRTREASPYARITHIVGLRSRWLGNDDATSPCILASAIPAARVPPRSTCALLNTVHPHHSLAGHSVHRPELGSDDILRTRAPLRTLLRGPTLALSSYAGYHPRMRVPASHGHPRRRHGRNWTPQPYCGPSRSSAASTRTYSIWIRAHLRAYAVQVPAGENETKQIDE
ncbi:hypothetical protein C8R44DRAFT_894964 [Mycena epipterygia]|nr:hypothetical protein C8R44DRAFT_894964 [Mycena epipterygia]